MVKLMPGIRLLRCMGAGFAIGIGARNRLNASKIKVGSDKELMKVRRVMECD